MNKALMISIQPQHAVNILNGKKTLELRTWIPKDYVGWVYVYVTKGKPYVSVKVEIKYPLHSDYELVHVNGKVAFRFWFDEYDVIEVDSEQHRSIMKETCLSLDEIIKYCKGQDLYAWHIKKLEVFDEPKQLNEFNLTKAPQRSVWIEWS